MFGLILGMAVAAGLIGGPQGPPPVFRAEVYVVPLQITVFEGRNWACGSKPNVNLTKTDFAITLDKKTYTPAESTQDPGRPGHYLLNFSPPEKYRDGKSHRIELRIQHRGKAIWVITIPTPSPAPFQHGEVGACCETECRSK